MATPNFSLTGQIALITGSTQGLGKAIARAYAACGAQVIINGRDPQRVAAAVAQLTDEGYVAHPMPLDIGQVDQHARAFSAICETVGPPTILVNNVGVRMRKPLRDFSLAEIVDLINIDLIAAIELSRLAAQSMIENQQDGRVITLTSIAGELARRGDSVYPIAKQGLVGLVRALAVEYGGHGVTSNGIAPGSFATETNAALSRDPHVSQTLIGRSPLGRWARPDEITGAAVFLASPSASYVNGHILVVDGGYSITF